MGEDALGVIGAELTAIGGDKLDDQIKSRLGEQTTHDALEKAADAAQDDYRENVGDHDLEQWMRKLPLGKLPKVIQAIEELPTSADESNFENALRESIALNWRKLSTEQVDHAVNVFMAALHKALLPLEKQTLPIIGRAVLCMENKVDLLVRWFEKYIITGNFVSIENLQPQLADFWNLKHPYAMPAIPNSKKAGTIGYSFVTMTKQPSASKA